MFNTLFAFWLVIISIDCFSQEKESCVNLAKLACEHQDSVRSEKVYNEFLDRINSRFGEALEAGLKKYPLNTFLKKTGLSKPAICGSENVSQECHDALKEEISETASGILNHTLGKASKFSDPGIPRNQFLFDLFDRISAKTSQKLMEEKKDEIKRIEGLFKNVKIAMTKNISNQINDPDKTALINRVNGIEFDSKLCVNNNYSADFLLKTSAFYEHKPHAFSICPRLLLSSLNDTQLSVIIGHEISHSIDPCESTKTVGKSGKQVFKPIVHYNLRKDLAGGSLESHPYWQQLKCLRQNSSAAAQTETLTSEDIVYLNGAKENPLEYQLCEKDQINESFSDWMGIEAAVGALRESQKGMSQSQVEAAYASVYSTKCKHQDPGFDLHPTIDRRANGILGVNPQVRNILKCQNSDPKYIYCAPPVATDNSAMVPEPKIIRKRAVK